MNGVYAGGSGNFPQTTSEIDSNAKQHQETSEDIKNKSIWSKMGRKIKRKAEKLKESIKPKKRRELLDHNIPSPSKKIKPIQLDFSEIRPRMPWHDMKDILYKKYEKANPDMSSFEINQLVSTKLYEIILYGINNTSSPSKKVNLPKNYKEIRADKMKLSALKHILYEKFKKANPNMSDSELDELASIKLAEITYYYDKINSLDYKEIRADTMTVTALKRILYEKFKKANPNMSDSEIDAELVSTKSNDMIQSY